MKKEFDGFNKCSCGGELEEIDASLQPSRQNLREKYSLANMAEALTQQEPVGIMSATR